jgi:hypothetical protein
VSIDGLGAIRLWRALDGSAPVALPQHGARALRWPATALASPSAPSTARRRAPGHLDASGAVLDVADMPAVPQALGWWQAPTAPGWSRAPISRSRGSIARRDHRRVSRDGTRTRRCGRWARATRSRWSPPDATGRAFAAVTLGTSAAT